MFVRDRMSAPAVTITPDTPFQDALKLMQERHFRRLPVVNRDGKLIGIVSERDLLHASPSPATTLSVWELNYLLSKLKVEELMSRNPLTVTPDTVIEDAARLMVENRVSGLPVVDSNLRVLGMITETAIFKAFVEMFAIDAKGLRLMLAVPNQMGTLAKLTSAIAALGGNILSVGTFGTTTGVANLVLKVTGVRKEQLVETLEGLGDHVLDVREV